VARFANHVSEVFEFITSKKIEWNLEAEVNVICGKEGEGNVNVLNVVVKGIAKRQIVVKVNKDENVLMWLLYMVHEALIQRRNGGESKWCIDPFKLTKLCFKSNVEGIGGFNAKLIVTVGKKKCRINDGFREHVEKSVGA
jgi:hypothetical protein